MPGYITGVDSNDASRTVRTDSDGKLLIGSYLVDENGALYGVKHIGNKPRVVATPYYVEIAKGNIPNHTRTNKFGRNSAVGASKEPVWDYSAAYEYLANDTFATMYISSDAAGDTGLVYNVQGIDDEYGFFNVNVTTDASDGRTFVAIDTGTTGTQAWRIFRALNTSGTPAAGNIYVSKDNTDAGGDGIPDTTTDIQAQVLIGNEQTLMALYTVPVDKRIAVITLALRCFAAVCQQVSRQARQRLVVRSTQSVGKRNRRPHQRRS